jgi:hypothetical protein
VWYLVLEINTKIGSICRINSNIKNRLFLSEFLQRYFVYDDKKNSDLYNIHMLYNYVISTAAEQSSAKKKVRNIKFPIK